MALMSQSAVSGFRNVAGSGVFGRMNKPPQLRGSKAEGGMWRG
jgi:hypothetical protein